MTPEEKKKLKLKLAIRRRRAEKQSTPFTPGPPPEGFVLDPQTGQMVGPGLAGDPALRTNIVDQTLSGVNEGIANTFGLPVDIATGAINLAGRGLGAATGLDVPRIESGFGGSETFRNALDPLISDVAPQSGPQRFVRRVGQEVGAGAPMVAAAPAIMGGKVLQSAATNFPKFATADVATDIGAGIGGATAQELAPENKTLEIIASLLGGGATAAATMPRKLNEAVPSLDELKATQQQAYGIVDRSTARLTPQATENISANILRKMTDSNMDEILHPKAARMMRIIEEKAGTSPTLSIVENTRRQVGRDVAGSLDPSEARLGKIMKQEIDDQLGSLSAREVTGDAEPAINALRTAREMTGRIKRSKLIEKGVDRAERQASKSGTGGNLVNTTRQRIDAILNSDKLRRGFSGDDIAAMDSFVRGTRQENFLRGVGRFSPTSGNLSALSAGLQGYGAATINPLLAAPAVAGFIAKGAAEGLGRKQIAKLLQQIRAGGPVSKQVNPAMKAILGSLLAQQTAGQAQ